MIQIRKKNRIPSPEILLDRGEKEAKLLRQAFDNNEPELKFKSEIYGHDDVKALLITVQEGKCCFCESKITHISYGDVEHYRPKGGWVQEDEPINKPGYFWLAYDWENLFLACQICNQRFKKNYFPLEDNTTRAKSYKDDLRKEKPIFIHPALDDPEKFISFNEEIPFAVEGNVRGEQTIKKLGIDRSTLNEMRMTVLDMIRTIYNLAKDYPPTPNELKNRARGQINRYFEESKLDSTQYASMLRSFFKKNPIDF